MRSAGAYPYAHHVDVEFVCTWPRSNQQLEPFPSALVAGAAARLSLRESERPSLQLAGVPSSVTSMLDGALATAHGLARMDDTSSPPTVHFPLTMSSNLVPESTLGMHMPPVHSSDTDDRRWLKLVDCPALNEPMADASPGNRGVDVDVHMGSPDAWRDSRGSNDLARFVSKLSSDLRNKSGVGMGEVRLAETVWSLALELRLNWFSRRMLNFLHVCTRTVSITVSSRSPLVYNR